MFKILSGKFTRYAAVAFSLSRFCELRPPEMFCRHRHFVKGVMSFVQESNNGGKLEGTINFSLKNTSPYLVDIFLLYWLNSSVMLSYCFLSKDTRVFSSFGSLMVSAFKNWRSVANSFSVSRRVFSWFQLFGSIAFIHWRMIQFDILHAFTPK